MVVVKCEWWWRSANGGSEVRMVVVKCEWWWRSVNGGGEV